MHKEILLILGLVIAVVLAVVFVDFAKRQEKPAVVEEPVVAPEHELPPNADIQVPKAYRLGEVPYQETEQFTETPPPPKVRDYVKGG